MELPLSRLDLNLLTVFDMLMQERNVTRAAERLHLSQSTVSHALGRLRQALDDPLFVMSRREMMPTERAKALASPVRQALAMLEQTNEIVRRFNTLVGKEVLTECQPILSDTGRLPGIDGKAKMSKSLGNTIELGMSSDEIKQAVFAMYTDPNHLKVSDPGQVEGNTVFAYLDAFHPDKALVAEMKAHYQRGGLGDMRCKQVLNDCLQALLAPMRERREAAIADKRQLLRLLQQGTEQARALTDEVLAEVKGAMGLDYFSGLA